MNMNMVEAYKRAIALIPGMAEAKPDISLWKAWIKKLPKDFQSLGRDAADGFAGEATLPAMERLFHILTM